MKRDRLTLLVCAARWLCAMSCTPGSTIDLVDALLSPLVHVDAMRTARTRNSALLGDIAAIGVFLAAQSDCP